MLVAFSIALGLSLRSGVSHEWQWLLASTRHGLRFGVGVRGARSIEVVGAIYIQDGHCDRRGLLEDGSCPVYD